MPAAAPGGTHANTTSNVVATVLGLEVTENAASDDIVIASLSFSKEFTDDPVLPGGTVNLRFTLENTSPTIDATGITFTDDLDDVLSGLASTSGTLSDICGTGSSISGTGFLTFADGNLLAGESCVFDLAVLVPVGAATEHYNNTTDNLEADLGGSLTVFPPATDALTVNSNLLNLTKSFTDDPVAPGDLVTLEFTLTNLDPSQPIMGIEFTDDLDAALTGLVASGLPPADNACNGSGTISGTDLLTFIGGSLAGGASCTFGVTLQVPAAAAGFALNSNTTSEVTGDVGGLTVTGGPATDDLQIGFLVLSKAFSSSPEAGDTVTLSFTIRNLNTTEGVSDLAFSDDLDAALQGLVVTGDLPTDPCGAGSVLAGTSLLTLTGGSLLPGGSCTLSVDLQVPAMPLAGSFLNVTSELRQDNFPGRPAGDRHLGRDRQITNVVTVTADGATPAMGQTTDTIQP